MHSDLFLGGPWINPIFIKQHYLACPLQHRSSLIRAQRMFEPCTEWRLHCLWIWVTIIVHVCLIAPVSGWHAKPVLMHAYTFLYMLNLVFTISATGLLNKDNKAKLLSSLLRQRSAAGGQDSLRCQAAMLALITPMATILSTPLSFPLSLSRHFLSTLEIRGERGVRWLVDTIRKCWRQST